VTVIEPSIEDKLPPLTWGALCAIVPAVVTEALGAIVDAEDYAEGRPMADRVGLIREEHARRKALGAAHRQGVDEAKARGVVVADLDENKSARTREAQAAERAERAALVARLDRRNSREDRLAAEEELRRRRVIDASSPRAGQ
jgi:hypothetical protein